MKILITGAAGYLGSQLCHALRNTDHDVYGLDNLSTGLHTNWQHCTQVGADLRQADAVNTLIPKLAPDLVVHLASLSEVRTRASAELYHDNNVQGTRNLVAAMQACGLKHIVVASSACVYGAGASTPLSEKSAQQALSVYAHNKIDIETILTQAEGMRSVILRPFVIAGFVDGYSGTKSETYDRHLLPRMCAIGSGRLQGPLQINGSQWPTLDGTCVRDFVHTADVCTAISLSLDYLLQDGASTTLNLGSGSGISILEALGTYSRLTGRDIPRQFGPASPADAPTLIADSDHAAKVLRWQPQRTFDDILRSEIAKEARMIGA